MMEKYFDETTQEMMHEWIINSVNSDGCSSGVYRVMATRSQLESILRSFADDEKRRGSEMDEDSENFSSNEDGSIYEYTVDFNNGEENWIEVTAYLVEKMNTFYAKDFINEDDDETSETSTSSDEAFDPDEKFQVKEPHILI